MTTFYIIVIVFMALMSMCSILFVFAFITFATNHNEKLDALTEGTMLMLGNLAMAVEKDDKLQQEEE